MPGDDEQRESSDDGVLPYLVAGQRDRDRERDRDEQRRERRLVQCAGDDQPHHRHERSRGHPPLPADRGQGGLGALLFHGGLARELRQRINRLSGGESL